MPYQLAPTIACQPRAVIAQNEVSIVINVAVPPARVDVSPMGNALAASIENTARAALQRLSIPLPLGQSQHLPAAVINSIVNNIMASWRRFWAEITPVLNQAVDLVLGRLQIFQQALAVTLFKTSAQLVLGAQSTIIPPVDVPIPGIGGNLHFTAGGSIPAVNITITNATFQIAQHLMTVTLTLQ